MLQVKEIFGPTIQGEGAQAGWPAIFVRFAGCNMWNGKPETRAKSMCPYCDTDFLGGTPMTVQEVLQSVAHLIAHGTRYLIVFTGGEPLLQPEEELAELVGLLNKMGHQTQVETNGTVSTPAIASFHHVTVSPKLPLKKTKVPWFYVDTLKLLHPHPSINILEFVDEMMKTGEGMPRNLYIQPIDDGNPVKNAANVREAIKLVKELGFPWRLSLQTHKIINER